MQSVFAPPAFYINHRKAALSLARCKKRYMSSAAKGEDYRGGESDLVTLCVLNIVLNCVTDFKTLYSSLFTGS